MELREGIRTTGTVRSFTSEPVPRDTVVELLDDARMAPSGGNRQPWRVAIIEDRTIRTGLGSLMQPVWDEYVDAQLAGQHPFNHVDYKPPAPPHGPHPNPLIADIETVPVVLAIAADMRLVALMDDALERPGFTGGASIYPFCWNLLLSARAHGLGGVLTTFLSRREPEAAELLGMPAHLALVATLFLGVPEHQPTKLTRREPEMFTTVDRFDAPRLSAT